jgi:gluconate 2-dehydrogenase gamma chain
MAENEAAFRRRHFLLRALGAVPVIGLAGEAAFITPAAHAQTTAPPADYQPSYFTDQEWAFLKAAAARFIPADETGPGAVEAGVPEFIDRQMNTDYGHGGLWYLQGPFNTQLPATLGYQLSYNPRDLYRASIRDIEDWCIKTHGKDFANLDPSLQDEVLTQLEHGKVSLPHSNAGVFFSQLLGNTKEGYFADPMYGGNRGMGAWKMIGFPGARADFADWAQRPGEAYPLGPVSILGEKG